MSSITPFLMFSGQAEEAINYYISLFDPAEIKFINHHQAGGAGKPGTVMQALIRLRDQEIMVIDGASDHGFAFNPSMSLFVTCESEVEIHRLYTGLLEGGEARMPLGNYGFSQTYGWVEDRFGVNWQLNLG